MIMTAENPRKLKLNHPADYEQLHLFERLTLNAWIVNHVEPFKVKTFGGPTSYKLKHLFEMSKNGFYITNGQMKGALDAVGFAAKDEDDLNWTYQLSNKLIGINLADLPAW